MGASSSSLWRIPSRSGDAVLATNNLPPITFHSTHGENVRVLCAGAVARRAESFCKGIAFSNRPLRLNEKIFMKFVETSASWSGVVRFGFTSVDPGTVRGALPKYACPDLTNKPGYWAKALAERYAEQDVVLFFYVTASGDVHFGINGEEKGVFFSGVDTRGPLWALLDIYGNTIAMEILDSRANLNNMLRRAVSLPSDVDNAAAAALEALSFSSPVSSSSSDPPVHFHAGIPTELISFHSVHGQNIRLSNDSTVATRNDTEFSCGYVFLKRPVSTDEKIIIQVLQTENIYIGALAFGLTNCDPAMLTFTPLPEDSDCLLDRPEYWVVLKDVANAPQRGDELAFTITTDGKVLLFKNRSPPVVIMYVDQTQRLWPFFDVYGNTTKIKILGCAKNTAISTNGTDVSNMSQLCVILPPLSTGSAHRAKAIPAANVHRKSLPIDQTFCPSPKSSLPDAGQGLDGCQDNANNECAVCYEKAIDCVLYTCGHMCMCFECAHQLWKRPAGGQCPICRADIRDVIRTYRS